MATRVVAVSRGGPGRVVVLVTWRVACRVADLSARDLERSTERRRALLRSRFNFCCQCARCEPSAHAAASRPAAEVGVAVAPTLAADTGTGNLDISPPPATLREGADGALAIAGELDALGSVAGMLSSAACETAHEAARVPPKAACGTEAAAVLAAAASVLRCHLQAP